ncbi:MAG: fibronectin type III domain-containing protein [Patescibacteria group bacterium]
MGTRRFLGKTSKKTGGNSYSGKVFSRPKGFKYSFNLKDKLEIPQLMRSGFEKTASIFVKPVKKREQVKSVVRARQLKAKRYLKKDIQTTKKVNQARWRRVIGLTTGFIKTIIAIPGRISQKHASWQKAISKSAQQRRKKEKSKIKPLIVLRKKKWWHFSPISIFVILIIGTLVAGSIQQLLVHATAATYTVSSQTEWQAGQYYPNQLDMTTTSGDLQIASGGVGSWSADTPGYPTNQRGYGIYTYEGANYGADLTTDGTYIYMIVGGNQPGFFRYNPELNIWKLLIDAPTGFYYGGSLAYYDGYIYAINGQDGSDDTNGVPFLFRYDIANNIWTQLSDAPDIWGLGSDLVSGNNGKLYATQGNSRDGFWSYNIATDTWNDTISSIPYPYQIYTGNGHPLVYSAVSYGTSPVYCETGCIYAFRGSNNREFFRYDISLAQWSYNFANVPTTLGNSGRISYGSSMAVDAVNGNIYAMTGYNNDEFMMYDIADQEWQEDLDNPPDMPGGLTVDEGGTLLYFDGYIYALPGINRPEFLRYDITAGAWDSIATPAIASNDYDSDLITFVPNSEDGCSDATGCLFMAQGRNTTIFYRYDIADGAWNTMTSTGLANISRGGSLCYDGNGELYLTRGINTTNFYSYDISNDAGGWSSIGSMPGAVEEGGGITCFGDGDVYIQAGNNTDDIYHYDGSWTTEDLPVTAYYGAGITNDGNKVYMLAGYYRAQFYEYDPVGDDFTELADLPEGSYYNAVLAYDGDDSIYAITGNFGTSMWRYSISGDSWSRASDTPDNFVRGIGMAHDDATDTMYIRRGFDTNSIYKFTTDSDDYIPTASWISPTYDLTYATSFNSFTATDLEPGGSTIDYYTRTSDDQVSWEDWTQVSGTTIGSSANRYIQVKVVLNSDDDNTPTVSEFTINYEKDSVNPTNPTVVGYADSTKGTALTTGNSYYYINPYFELTGAVDAESGLAGYYLSWTTNASHDPTSSEDYFQTGTTYEVNTDLTNSSTYYLRVAAKDDAGNTDDVETIFTYTYNGISPAGTNTWTVQADFQATGTLETNINTAAESGTSLTLDSVSNGIWTNEAPIPWVANNVGGYYGSGLSYDGDDTIFMFRGYNRQEFYAYSVADKTYSQLANYGSGVYGGASMVYVPTGTYCADSAGCVFATGGNNTATFRRYNVNAGTWTDLSDFEGSQIYYGSQLAYDGANAIYATRGDATNEFWKYNIITDVGEGETADDWTQLTGFDQLVYYGGTLVYVPNGDYCSDEGGCLYATRGYGDTDFYSYRVSANTWSYEKSVPIWTHYGASAYYLDGYFYLVRGYAANGFLRYDIANENWEWLDDLPTTQYQGGAGNLVYVPSNDTMYTIRGYQVDYALLAYDVSENRWKTPTLPHTYTNYGFYYGAVAYDNDNDMLYVARGGNSNEWWSYDIANDVWKRRANAPMRVRPGASAQYINHSSDQYDGVYLLPGESGLTENEGTFWRYDINDDKWTRLDNTNTAANETNYGSDLVFDGTNTIYTARGANTTEFYKYTIDTDIWETVASAIPGTVYTGGCAANGGDGYIYMVRGNNQDDIYRFNIGSQTWDVAGTLSLAPGNMRYGDACVPDGQGNILIPRGDEPNGNEMYVYDISEDSWSTRDTTSFFEYGDLVMTGNNVVLGFRGEYTTSMERYVVATSSTGFEGNGYWTSEILDFEAGVYGYGGLTVNVTEPANTSISIETRTCSNAGCADDEDDVNWGDWTAVSNNREISSTNYYSIDSTVAQYGQVRIYFVTDQLYSPTVDDLTWSYYTDGTAPTNPTSATGYTEDGGTEIATDTWVNDATPYFEWTGADNAGGIGLSGFYVYFGNDSGKDPVDDASDPTNLAYVSGTNLYSASGNDGSWNAATQAASALTSDTYYLIIKTVDNNGNITTNPTNTFTYKLDIIDPSNPSDVSATPSGYTSTNDFDFSWDVSTDGGGSGVEYYCYKTGAPGAVDTCIDDNHITEITAYRTRGNIFYVRALDEAGNYSSYATTTYYYAGSPPTAPQNLVATPTSATNNNTFSFSWSLPATCLGQTPCDVNEILRYCFTINELPSAENCGTNTAGNTTPSPDGGWTSAYQTDNRLLPGFSAATQQGTNTLYLVAADVINNIDYDNYTSTTYDFTSTAPDPPASLQATDSSDRSTQKYSVTLTWDETANAENFKVYRCEEDCENPSTVADPPDNYTNIATTTTLGYLDTSLDNTITYSYFIRAVGSGNAASGNSAVESIKPEGKFKFAPTMSGQPTVTPYIRSVLVEWLTLPDQDRLGNVIPHPATSFVQYGTTEGLGEETGTSELVDEHEVLVTGLSPDTLYYYKLVWVDQDGNTGESAIYEVTTLGAPSAPVNLAVDPESNMVNRFTFSWAEPVDEGITVGGYYYSINAPPNEDNVYYTTHTEVGPIAAATQQGINNFYVVATDDAGNVNYANYAVVDFEAHTIPPDAPLNPEVFDVSNRADKEYRIMVSWNSVDPPSASGIVKDAVEEDLEEEITYTIYRAVEEDNDYEVIATTKSTAYIDTDLEFETLYFYKVKAADKAGSASAATDPVEEIADGRYTTPPEITAGPAIVPDSFAATVTWKTERPASSFVLFGTSATDYDREQGTSDLIDDHSVTITGLDPETTYYYQVKSIDRDENEAYSDVTSFITLEAPRVSEMEITDIRLYEATISWKTNKETTTQIQYGTTTDYGLTYTDTSGSTSFTHTIKLTGLADGTTYNLRVYAEDASGNKFNSDNYVFTTLTFPRVSDVTSENKAEGQTEIRWTTNVPTTSEVEYYNENEPSKTQGNTALVTDHSVLLFGLNDATIYNFVVRGRDQFGYEAVSVENNFRTLEDTTPPTISHVKYESNTVGSGDAARIQIIVSFRTDEPTTTAADFGEGLGSTSYSASTDINPELVQDHLMIIPDLEPARTYHFRTIAVDKAGNETKSDDYSVLTSRARESFLQIVISNLEQTFSWLGNIGNLF